MPETTGISDQTKKVLIGVAAAATVAGVGYMAYKSLSGSDLDSDLEAIKSLGNLKFKEKNYEEAIKEFTRGIEKAGPNTNNTVVAMLYQNRAACREKVGHTSFDILNDCLAALKVDKKYAKAYLRAAKALNDIGKKQDALAYLLAAFTLDSNLNKANFEFFGKLLTVEPLSDCFIGKPLKIEEVKPAPVALFRIQQWCDTWDVLDLFKTDLTKFEPDVLSEDQKQYQLSLELFKKGKYEDIINLLSAENNYAPAMIFRGKMLCYSMDPNEATRYVDKNEARINEMIGNEENEERKKLMRDAFDVLKIELMYTMEIPTISSNRRQRTPLQTQFLRRCLCGNPNFPFQNQININFQYNGCVLDTTCSTDDGRHPTSRMNSLQNNANRLLEEAAKHGTLTPHLTMIAAFLKLCTCEDYGDVHRRIREMEELTEQRSTHFNLILMSKVYMMTNNAESSEKLLNEAAKIKTRYLVPSRHLQTADLHVHKPEDERLRLTTASANAALEVDPFNFSAHVLHLLGTNGPEPYIKKSNYDQAMESIRKAALFAPPRELLMLKRMIPLMNAKKRAAEMLDMY
ncbi:Protein CBG06925 [Caenorhabditis briggsae]|uniref:Protein CBG06925 n=1 Tax=Caenorhabditis briggsae TaxID=6238 RepID=A8X3D6_CAEBR|nr:Protein CBG06925 [Caenorhabditis briggsae]CAP27146.2 Protein CBG06925 [Caenorhabditis briggsae]